MWVYIGVSDAKLVVFDALGVRTGSRKDAIHAFKERLSECELLLHQDDKIYQTKPLERDGGGSGRRLCQLVCFYAWSSRL